jgi:hypothetical protein
VFKNRVLRKIFGPKRKEIIGDLRRFHNEKLHSLYSLPYIIGGDYIKNDESGRACGTHMGLSTGAYRVVMGKSGGKNHLEDLGIDWRKI